MIKKRKFRKDKFFSSIEVKKRNLLHAAGDIEGWFDEAVNPRISELKQEIEDTTQKFEDLYDKLTDEEDSNDIPSDHDIGIYGGLGGLDYDLHILEEQLLSIETMRLVYLYKSFEILLKDIVAEAFPRASKRELFQWEYVKSFLNSNGVMLGEVKEYQCVNKIRIVNNNIKHSSFIDETTQKQNIPEFAGKDDFDSVSIASFYFRIKNKPKIFLRDLSEKIVAYLFEFDDERIKTIANEYKERMDSASGQKLITELSEIYG